VLAGLREYLSGLKPRIEEHFGIPLKDAGARCGRHVHGGVVLLADT